MAARNMIKANSDIFARLDKYCAERGDVIQNSGTPRWIESLKGEDKTRLKEAVLSFALSFGSTVKIARFDHDRTSLFCTIGFDLPEYVPGLVDETLEGGMLTAILSELAPLPISSTAEIRNIIEVSDRASTEGYSGHDSELIAGLFPAVRCFSTSDLSADETHREGLKNSISNVQKSTP